MARYKPSSNSWFEDLQRTKTLLEKLYKKEQVFMNHFNNVQYYQLQPVKYHNVLSDL